VQQGMNPESHLARRYHWHSTSVRNFVCEPHSAIVGRPQGEILNLVDARATKAQGVLLTIAKEPMEATLEEARKLTMPMHHDVRAKDVDLKRLGAVLRWHMNSHCATLHRYYWWKGWGRVRCNRWR
jgi:hypothetical protein